MGCPLPFLIGKGSHDNLEKTMGLSLKDQRYISSLLLVCSVASILLFYELKPGWH